MLKDRDKALDILRRISDGDSKATNEIEPLLQSIKRREEESKKEREAADERRKKRQSGGRKNGGKFEIARKVERGVDYGADGIVLAKSKDGKRLIWRYGHMSYMNRMQGSTYTPAHLMILEDGRERLGRGVSEPGMGRMTLGAKIIMRYAEKIDAEFGAGTAAEVAKLKGTVIL